MRSGCLDSSERVGKMVIGAGSHRSWASRWRFASGQARSVGLVNRRVEERSNVNLRDQGVFTDGKVCVAKRILREKRRAKPVNLEGIWWLELIRVSRRNTTRA